MFRHFLTLSFAVFLVFVAGCGQISPPGQPLVVEQEEDKPICVETEESLLPSTVEEEMEQQMLDAENSAMAETWGTTQDRGLCYKFRPSVPAQQGKKKKKGAGTVACCQPQSLIYARCRSGIETCRMGDTSPVQWFSCAKKMGNTSSVPASGSIMVLESNARRKMNTGHPVYVENAKKNSNGTWLLRISHTNYDRQCNLDLDAGVIFDPARMTVSFQSGPWSCWASDLKILGFIRR